ncbi:hypothetical protein GOBAR_DD24235 [Gossypium barbadense]|nr:hypothetical protein GOBAR_DD24235 [Gossypium barbadense]
MATAPIFTCLAIKVNASGTSLKMFQNIAIWRHIPYQTTIKTKPVSADFDNVENMINGSAELIEGEVHNGAIYF